MLRLLPPYGKTCAPRIGRKPNHLDECCAIRRHAVGKDAKLIAPHVSDECLNDALRLELNYLKDDLTSNAADRSDKAFIHNAYAALTACRILYSAYYRRLAYKHQAYRCPMETVPPTCRAVLLDASVNR